MCPNCKPTLVEMAMFAFGFLEAMPLGSRRPDGALLFPTDNCCNISQAISLSLPADYCVVVGPYFCVHGLRETVDAFTPTHKHALSSIICGATPENLLS